MIKIIAAVSKNSVIGNKTTNSIPWSYPEDMKHFRESTKDSVVIMGKQTYLSIGKLLPKRTNIIVSSTISKIEDAIVADSLKSALEIAKKENKTIWIIGGASLYNEGLQFADEIILTLVPKTIEGLNEDLVYFPKIDMTKFKIVSHVKLPDSELSVVTLRELSLPKG